MHGLGVEMKVAKKIRIPTRLYHGTVVSRLDQIQRHGIQPRLISGAKGNISETIGTRSGYRRVTGQRDAVYLSDGCDPWHYAANVPGDNGPGLILEIPAKELRTELFAADEDFLASCWLRPNEGFSQKHLDQMANRARGDLSLVAKSLAEGSVAYYGAIPWTAVTRYVVIDWDEIDRAWKHWATHEEGCTRHNRAFTHWLFGDSVTANKLLPSKAELAELACWGVEKARLIRDYEQYMKNRSGIQVIAVEKGCSARDCSNDAGGGSPGGA